MTKPWTCGELLDEGIDGAIETRAAGGAPIVPADVRAQQAQFDQAFGSRQQPQIAPLAAEQGAQAVMQLDARRFDRDDTGHGTVGPSEWEGDNDCRGILAERS